jgi:hypothetical protein
LFFFLTSFIRFYRVQWISNFLSIGFLLLFHLQRLIGYIIIIKCPD